MCFDILASLLLSSLDFVRSCFVSKLYLLLGVLALRPSCWWWADQLGWLQELHSSRRVPRKRERRGRSTACYGKQLLLTCRYLVVLATGYLAADDSHACFLYHYLITQQWLSYSLPAISKSISNHHNIQQSVNAVSFVQALCAHSHAVMITASKRLTAH